jgi:hypothetical protein
MKLATVNISSEKTTTLSGGRARTETKTSQYRYINGSDGNDC